jgi:hypothetical protein
LDRAKWDTEGKCGVRIAECGIAGPRLAKRIYGDEEDEQGCFDQVDRNPEIPIYPFHPCLLLSGPKAWLRRWTSQKNSGIKEK